MKENSPNKMTAWKLHINPLRNKFDRNLDILLSDVLFPSAEFILKAMLFIIDLTDTQMVEYCYF